MMVGACEGAAKGAGIRPGKGLMVGGGGAKFGSGLDGSPDCALAAASGTTARVKAARTRMSCRMMRCSIAVPWRRSSYAARIANGRGRYCVVHGSQLRNFAQSSAMPRSPMSWQRTDGRLDHHPRAVSRSMGGARTCPSAGVTMSREAAMAGRQELAAGKRPVKLTAR